MWKFPKYSLGFLALRDIFKAFSLPSIDVGDRAWSLTFSIYICINYLNSFSVENRAVKAGAGIRAWEVGVGKLLLVVKALEGPLTSSSSLGLTSGRFWRGLQ